MRRSSLTFAIIAGVVVLASSVTGPREGRAKPLLNVTGSGGSIVSFPLSFSLADLSNTVEASLPLTAVTSQGPTIATSDAVAAGRRKSLSFALGQAGVGATRVGIAGKLSNQGRTVGRSETSVERPALMCRVDTIDRKDTVRFAAERDRYLRQILERLAGLPIDT